MEYFFPWNSLVENKSVVEAQSYKVKAQNLDVGVKSTTFRVLSLIFGVQKLNVSAKGCNFRVQKLNFGVLIIKI
jgi:hypothetical protein